MAKAGGILHNLEPRTRVFLLVWWGQLASLLGTRLSEFGLAVWLYQTTDSITQFAFIFIFIYVPNILMSPFAGNLIDRWNRRWVMILSDCGAAVGTLLILILTFAQRLELWHVYLGVTIFSCATAFHRPAYAAAITQLVPPKDHARANGMVQIANGVTKVIAPAIAGFLIGIIQLQGILLIDGASFSFALISLLVVRFPHFKSPKAPSQQSRSLFSETIGGWNYIVKRAGLKRLLLYVAMTYLMLGILEIMMWPLILNYASSAEFGVALSLGSCGAVLGSVLMSVWGGPRRRVFGVFGFISVQAILMILGGFYAKHSIIFVSIGIFGFLFSQPIIVSCNRAIWQSKVPVNLQGRVFALQLMLEQILAILGYLVTGPLIENLFDPLLSLPGGTGKAIAQVLGVGPGRGIGFLLILMGFVCLLATTAAFRDPLVRRIDLILPDANQPQHKLQTTSARP